MSKNIVIAIALILNCMVTFTIFPNIVALTTLGFPKYLSFSFCSLSYDLFSILGKAIAKKINTKKKETLYAMFLIRNISIPLAYTILINSVSNPYIYNVYFSWFLLFITCTSDGFFLIRTFGFVAANANVNEN